VKDDEALTTARDAFSASTTYVDANFRKQWQDALRMFQSKHPQDSKYNSESYKYRSRIFRPKTRAIIRKNEAAAAAAFFSNVDVVNIDAANDQDPEQLMGAEMYKALLQYRLTKSIPWFLTLIGACQDAMTVGVVCSYQYWKYRERVKSARNYIVDEQSGVPKMGFEGGPLYYDEQSSKVLEDKPCIDLLPVENLRLDKGASWTDPVNSSPYLIHLIPMYVGDIKLMAEDNAKTGEKGWDVPDDSKLLAATRNAYDPTRQIRENREDSKDTQGKGPTEFDIAWVHKNIVRKNGEDFCYYTLGVEHLLSKPQPLEKLYFHGERPYVMGCAIIETHKIYPSGFPEIGRELQKEANEVANQRLDNVKLVLNKRFLVKRGAQVDVRSLVRNVAASVTMVNNVEGDVREMEFNDVTQSSYAEQDRINVDMDELMGNFSSSSVQTNRKLNETVGGMAMLNQGASQMSEYTIRTITETWVEPVLRQLVKLEKHYETDETVLKLVGQKLGVQIQDKMFDTDVELTVNVGMGATDPMMRLNKLLAVGRAVSEIAQLQGPINKIEFSKEAFGIAGYRDGGRFIQEQEDPRIQELMQIAQQLKEELIQAEDRAEQDMQRQMAELEIKRDMAMSEQQIDREKVQSEHEMKVAELRNQFRESQIRLRMDMEAERQKLFTALTIAREKAQTQIEISRENAKVKREQMRAAPAQ
jgi:hypothetical protein